MNEKELIEKLRLIEALFVGAATKGEKVAAERARERILERLRLMEKEEPLVEYRFSMEDMWSRKVFVALLRRYGIKPYRYYRQRYTTVMARVSKRFVDETLWPEFLEISETLRDYLSEITDRVVSQVIHRDSSEAEVVKEQMMLPSVSDETVLETGSQTASTDRASGAGSAAGDPAKSKRRKNRSKAKRKKRKKRRR
ncbi:MAG: hypothetical protein U9Q05_03660 [Thermodesulfobacteriota bacterium]|nr:hypothetical protein [Thermodesulfobacteriota bacterium]